jgi:hypothetical protein
MLINCDVERRRKWGRDSYHRRKQVPENVVRFLWSHAKRRAKQKEVPFDITHEDIVVPEHCPIMGVKLTGRGENVKTSPSVDRIVPELGYVKGNIRVISTQANRMKWDSDREELELFCRGMLKLLETESPSC